MALPEGYSVPKGQGVDRYLQPSKLPQGATKLRFMSDIITGYVYWDETPEGKRPFRVPSWKDLPNEVKARKEERPRHFWAAVVWNYSVEEAQIFEITQSTIQEALEGYELNEDYGDLTEYDITITRKGEGRDTSYVVVPSPKKSIDKKVTEYVKSLEIDVTALYRGEDPFNGSIVADQENEEMDLDSIAEQIDGEVDK